MRLTALTISRYGNFEDQRINFSPDPGVVNLLMLPNGGGKSVMRTAFSDLLFGIGGQSPMGFRFAYNQMRILAEATADGTAFTFARRKRNTNTLVDADDKPLDPATITRFLGGMDRKRLERLFALDTERLRAGERDLLDSDGELGAALISGAGGTRNLRDLRVTLREACDQRAPRRRVASRPFYIAADAFTDARRRKSAAALSPDAWRKQEQARDAARAQQAEANQAAQAAAADLTRLERIRRVRPLLTQHDAAQAWLDANPGAPVLDPALKARLQKLREAVVKADLALAKAEQDRQRTQQDLAGITVDDAILAEADAINLLRDQAGAARKARRDLPSVQAELDTLTAHIHENLRELGQNCAIDQIATLIPTKAASTRIARLIKAHAAQRRQEQSAPEAVAARSRDKSAIQDDLDRLPATGDLSAVQALVKDIRSDGDPARTLRAARQARDSARLALDSALALLPGWTQDAAALAALRPRTADAYERQAKNETDAAAKVRQCAETLDAARQDETAAKDALDRLTGAAPLPDAERLAMTRERRDQGWRLIYRRAFTADPPGAEEEAEFAGPLPLPLAYERSVAEADSMADRRVDQASQIAQAETAAATLAQARAKRETAEQVLRAAQEAQAAAHRAWQQLCGIMPLGEAPTIQDVRTFLNQRQDAVAALTASTAAETALSSLEDTHQTWATRLASALGQPTGPLPDLLAAADQLLAAATKANEQRATLLGKLQLAEKSLEEAQAQLRKADQERADWHRDWAEAMQALGRPATEDPDTADANLHVLGALDQARKERADRLRRVEGMQADITRFSADTTALGARLAPELDAADPFAVTTALAQRLSEARDADTLRAERRKQAEDAVRALERAEADRGMCQADLAAVLTVIGADTPEAAEARLVLADERSRQADSLRQAVESLRLQGDSLPLETLREEAKSVLPDALPGLIAEAQARRDAAAAQAQDAAAQAASLTHALKADEDDTRVNTAAADQQAALATLGRVLEEALVHHIAAELLDQAIASVEDAAAPEVLKRIGVLFHDLTTGAYTRVQTETVSDNQTNLVLVQREHPDELQSVKSLSEGTRDQLFLALRLAAIEEHARIAPPLPFIGDDILQTFDDDRAVAALKVLCDVSDKVQVILLTHHRHVLDLAAQLPAGSVHICNA
jgi:uncharacterized protein YhaN